MKIAKAITGMLGLFVSVPIWYYLLYQVLVRVQATELMFFLFWVYVPVGILIQAVKNLADAEK